MSRTRLVRLLVAAIAITVIAVDFVRIDSASHSVSDTLLSWVPDAAIVLVVAWAVVVVTERLAARRT